MLIEYVRRLIAEFSLPAIKSRPADTDTGILQELLSHRHPDRREGEAFLGYWTPSIAAAIPWPSKRIGDAVYDEHGNRYPAHLSREMIGVPVFANAYEVARGMRRVIRGH